jgi:hypothetical protein
LVFWVNATARAALMSKFAVFVAGAMPTLLGVVALPVSSNSTVKV